LIPPSPLDKGGVWQFLTPTYLKEMNQLKPKLVNYPDWERKEQIKRNRSALAILEQRRQKRSQITDEQDQEISQCLLNFQTAIDNARPLGLKLYSLG
jgi:hypothetical protein